LAAFSIAEGARFQIAPIIEASGRLERGDAMPWFISIPSLALLMIDFVLMFHWMNASFEEQARWDRGMFPTDMRVFFGFLLFFVFGLGAFGH
jgi:hypothetical protein